MTSTCNQAWRVDWLLCRNCRCLWPLLLLVILLIITPAVSAETVRDEFNAISYSNNDGTQNWTTDWLEINEGDGASSGDERVTSDQGNNRLRVRDNDGGGEGIQREANLTGAISATLSFVYRRRGLDNANDYVTIDVSNDGGATWTELDRFTGPGNDFSYQSASYNITAYIASNTRIRFLSSSDLGRRDRVYFDNVQIDYALPVVNHFAISHDGSGNNCQPERVIITKHDSLHNVDTGYTGTINISTSTASGTWALVSGSGTFNDLGSGNATYTFVAGDNGQVSLDLSNTLNQTVNINVTDGTDSEYLTEDSDLIFSNLTVRTYRDEFGSVSYSNNDGTQSWATDWLEINESDGANNGDVRVVSNGGDTRLRLRDNDGGGEGAQREADLTGAASATLSFIYRRTDLDNANDYATVDISDDGGATWTELDRFSGPADDSNYQSVSYNITAYIASNTRVRFLTSNNMGGGDEVYFDDVQIETSVVNICGSLDHFDISVPDYASVCDAGNAQIGITAMDSSNNPITSYVGLVNLSTSNNRGDWAVISANGTLNNATADDGAATYQYVVADNGAIVLDLDMSVETTVTVTVQDASAGVSSQSSDINFRRGSRSLIITNDPIQVAGRPQAMTVTKLQNNCTVDTGFDGNRDTRTWITRDVNDPGGAAPSISAVSLPNSDPGSNNLTFNFTNGVSTFNLDTTDVGKYALNIRQGGRRGSSDIITTRPFGFYVTAAGNPGAVDANGAAFKRAGETFSVTVTAKAWEAADDANNDGIPDGFSDTDPSNNADLSGNATTVSFGSEPSPATVTLSTTLVAPSLGVDPGLVDTLVDGFLNGSASRNTSWVEVGIIEINANITGNNYLGTGGDVLGRSGYVGRFYPDHFALSGGSITNRSVLGCAPPSAFTYMDEAFNTQFTLTAQASGNTTTANYTGVFAKLDTSLPGSFNFGAINVGPPNTQLTARIDTGGSPTGSWANGIVNMNYPLAIFRVSPEDGPFNAVNIGIAPSDSDGVVLNTLNLDTTESGTDDRGLISATQILFGRVAMQNAFGSELLDLGVSLHVEYFIDNGFVINEQDDCTTPVTVTLTGVSGSVIVDDGDTPGETCVQDTGNPGDSGAGCAAPGPAAEQYQVPPDLVGNIGDFNLFLNAPDAGNTGSVDVDVTVPSYLQYDWNGNDEGGDGNLFDDNPSSRATFGIYRGQGQTIYQREQW